MSNISTITLADGQSTPVDALFDPSNPQYGSTPAKWFKKDVGPFTGFSELTQLLSRKGTSTRLSIKLRVPYLNDDGSKRAQNLVTTTFIIDDNCTEAERQDILAFAKGIMSHATVAEAVIDMEPTY